MMKKILFFSAILVFSACNSDDSQPVEITGTWDAELIVENVMIDEYESSTQLALSWTAPEENPDHYRVNYVDGVTLKENSVDTEEIKFNLENLKAATDYEITIVACLDSDCSSIVESGSTDGKTSEEYWQIQGEGSSYKEADHVVEDGQTIAQISRLEGDELKMYYNPGVLKKSGVVSLEDIANQWKGMRVAISDDDTYKTFTAIDSGIKNICNEQVGQPSGTAPNGNAPNNRNLGAPSKSNPKIELQSESTDSCPDGGLIVSASQAIPIKTKTEEFVRLFFEAQESDGDRATYNYYLDSQDGLIGEDFNPSTESTICGEDGDGLAIGGECDPTLILDTSDGLKNARQSKIALPLLDSQYWDMESGTFMVITGEDTCGATRDGLFYAQWDGEEWVVDTDEEACAIPLALGGHGPVIVHLGGDKYKLYYEEYVSGGDRTQKPLKVFYTDGNNIENFESYTNARDVHFLWPNGDELSTYEESGLGDHYIYLPTLDLTQQYMVLNLGGLDDDTPEEPSTGLGLAILMNP